MQKNKYLQEITNFFIRRGKKAKLEGLMYKFFMNKAKNKVKGFQKILRKSYVNACPVLYLKSRKRGKRNIYRIHYLEKSKGYKRSLRNIGLSVKRNLSANPRKFNTLLDKELLL